MNEKGLQVRLALIRSRAGARVFSADDNIRLARATRVQGFAGRPSVSAPTNVANRHLQIQRLLEVRKPTR